MEVQRTKIGYLVGGGLKENFRVRLTVSPQEIQEGAFVVIQSGDWNYYGIVVDITLGATDPRFADEQTGIRYPPNIAKALYGQTLYANLEVLPNLMLEIGPEPGSPDYKDWQGMINAGLKDPPRILPVKNVPPHHAQVYLADEGDIAEIFGEPGHGGNFIIGYTREQNHPVCIDLEKFVQRSSGVFGATGTGKSFLTRVVLAGLINSNKASVLVLDMHNEYGLWSTDEEVLRRLGRDVVLHTHWQIAERVRTLSSAPTHHLEDGEGIALGIEQMCEPADARDFHLLHNHGRTQALSASDLFVDDRFERREGLRAAEEAAVDEEAGRSLDARRRNRLETLRRGHQERRRLVRPHHPRRMRIEGHRDRCRAALFRAAPHALDDLQMTTVHAVEIAEREDGLVPADRPGIIWVVDDVHQRSISKVRPSYANCTSSGRRAHVSACRRS